MEINVTKQSVYTNEVIFNQSFEQPIDTDFSLPDYCPDIVRLLKCGVKPRISSKSIAGDMLTIDGGVTATLIYCDENDKIRSFEYDIPFQKSVTVGEIEKYNSIKVDAVCDYMNTRIVTPRKAELHGAVSLTVKITGTVSTEILTDIDCESVQLKSGSCPQSNPLGFGEKTVVIEEELELGRANASVRSVIRNETRAVIDSAKLMGGKAVVSGEIIINTLYCTEEDTVAYSENSVGFNQIIDLNVNGEDCVCDAAAEITSCAVKPRTNLSGEARSLALECKLCISAWASCDNDIPVLLDAFGTAGDIQLEAATINFKKLAERVSERSLCKKTLEFSENSFGNVIDMWCENKIGQVNVTDNTLTVGGVSLICILCTDTDGAPQYYERSVDFEYRAPTSCKNAVASAASVETVSTSYTVLGDSKLEAVIELSVSASVYSVTAKRVITGISLPEVASAASRPPFIVYYAKAGEQLWDIAKRYRSCCCDIMTANTLEDEELLHDKMLIIP